MPNVYPRGLASTAIGALAAATALPALAADLDYPPPGPSPVYRQERMDVQVEERVEERIEEHLPPPPRPVYGPRFVPRFSAGPGYAPVPREACRTTVTRRVEFDGDEVERRVSVCDGVPDHRLPIRPHLRDSDPLPPGAFPDDRW